MHHQQPPASFSIAPHFRYNARNSCALFSPLSISTYPSFSLSLSHSRCWWIRCGCGAAAARLLLWAGLAVSVSLSLSFSGRKATRSFTALAAVATLGGSLVLASSFDLNWNARRIYIYESFSLIARSARARASSIFRLAAKLHPNQRFTLSSLPWWTRLPPALLLFLFRSSRGRVSHIRGQSDICRVKESLWMY